MCGAESRGADGTDKGGRNESHPAILGLFLLLLLPGTAKAWDRDAAVSHAHDHRNDTSETQPGGYYADGDCTNYASNCLYAGGIARIPWAATAGGGARYTSTERTSGTGVRSG